MMLCLSCTFKPDDPKEKKPLRKESTANVQEGGKPTKESFMEPKEELTVEASSSNDKLDGTTIFEKYSPAVFMVYASNDIYTSQGSGFFIDGNGLAVSNYHVFKGTFKGEEAIMLSGSDKAYHVTKVIHNDEDDDFIIFRVNISNNKFIPLARSKPKTGEKVYAIGSPRQLKNTLSSGEVSGWRGENYMQISVPIDHGSSGGALINEYGQAVGITTAGIEKSGANLNFAISIDVIKPYVDIK